MPAELARTTCRMKKDLHLASICLTTNVPDTITTWLPPHNISFKLNVDAGYLFESKEASLGMVVRDSLGSVHLCAVTRVANIKSSLHAKLKTILFGLKEASSTFFLLL